MKKTLLKSKLHRINVTQVELNYEGSCAVDKEFLELAGMQEYEKVDVYNVTNGERFSTYLILAEAGSKTLSVNGAIVDSYAVKQVNFSEFFLNLFKVVNVTIFLFDLVNIIIN